MAVPTTIAVMGLVPVQPAFGAAMSPRGARPGLGAGLVPSGRKKWVSLGQPDTDSGPLKAALAHAPARPELWHVCSSAKPWQEPPDTRAHL